MSASATVTGSPLLETKLHAPRHRQEVVERPRLAARFIDLDPPALTLVSAPAGFGKTTLLAQWAQDENRRSAWLSLDTRDNDPALFVEYLIAAVRSVLPDVGDAALSSLHSAQSALEPAVATLINEFEQLTIELVMVLDDYHLIESPVVHGIVTFLIERLPRHIHLVVASRSDPPFPLARMRARGELLEIRVADLRFTSDEAATYFNESMGLDLSQESVRSLEARTEGWAAALQLAALSMRGRDDVDTFINNFTGDDRFVVDFLAEEVLERLPAEVHTFLLKTAVLTRMTGSLCDAVTGGSSGAAMLESLDRSNLFIVPLDNKRVWYRYHHLFADVLRARLIGEHPEWVSDLHRRASTWYESQGELPDAITHATAGQDFERAASLIEIAAPATRQARQETTLRGWLEALPSDLFGDRPVLSTLLVGARMGSGDTTGVRPLIESAADWLEGRREGSPVVSDHDEFARLPAQVAMYRAALALLDEDVQGATAHASRIVELAAPGDHLLLGAAAALTGLAFWRVGELDAARLRYAAAVQHFVDADFIPDVLGCSLALGDIQVGQGRISGAKAAYEAGLEHARGRPGLRGTADMLVGLSEIHLDRGDVDGADEHLEASRQLGEHAGLPQHAYRWRVAASRLSAARGDYDDALRLLDEADVVYNTDFSPAVRPISALRARIHLARGDLSAAKEWVRQRGIGPEDPLDYLSEYDHITLARTLVASGDATSLATGISLLDRLLALAKRDERIGSAAEILVVLGRAHQLRGEIAEATSAIEAAIALAEPEGYLRPFLDEGPQVSELVQRASLDGAAAAHARRILGGASPVVTRSAPTGIVDDLSTRELDVLRLLRSDLSGPDIARELLVSVNTLRTHTKNIYMKLGVNNRREAVSRAAELGL